MDSPTITRTAVRDLLDKYPRLCDHGMHDSTGQHAALLRSWKHDHDTDRERLISDWKAVRAAALWIATLRRRARADRHCRTSYGLKHVMEDRTGVYVTNGAFIAAALLVGVPVRGVHDSPNPLIGVFVD